uniref:proline--tRNA ligase n=1 Tax=Romanomermis culicivorax TaxID=13658 RepID=A0A915HS45_ROMCU
MRKNLFTTNDNNGNLLCLAPTHEEPATSLFLDKLHYGPKNLPFLLYQISTKFRDEALPRYGLLRSKEFLMKDLYSFHENENCAKETYDLVNESYARLLGDRLGLQFFRVKATSGAMGGTSSHEFHLENACGQDEILYCKKCRTGFNMEVL